jgi:phage baseplate assembly protein W
MNIATPLRFDHRGRTAQSRAERYVRELIEIVLFTAPGERVMRPEFGSGVAQLVFAPNSPELAGTTQLLVQAALHRWLSELVTVHEVRVDAEDAALRVRVAWSLRGDIAVRVDEFSRGVPA